MIPGVTSVRQPCEIAIADVARGDLDLKQYESLSEMMLTRFPNLLAMAITLRESRSTGSNGWSACFRDTDGFRVSTKYEIMYIIDRVGAGDSFAASLIHGLHAYDDHQQSLELAVAASCLKHSIPGDSNRATVAEVENLMGGDTSARVKR
ncbi:MAG: PfkB family carbohydrate kinase [Gammaproteobacteria bacterium]|nr:PfkB family carbohydrate kinase [Gammaproteobacteria bacterium]